MPQQSAFVVERLGRFAGTLDAGFHILVPFIDVIRYKHSLKEMALDIPAQICITRDNVQVQVDGVLYLKVLNPERTSYGITDYMFAISQLAQTTLRSEVGKIDLDRTFEERTNINISVVAELDKATEPWGVKVLRYEVKSITPPADILAAMEKQMRAEREKRAVILTSEGQRDAAINSAEGEKQQVIKASEARRQQQINEAEGQASAILAVATANAEGIRRVAEATQRAGRRRGDSAEGGRAVHRRVRQGDQQRRHDHPAVEPRRRGVDDHDGDECRLSRTSKREREPGAGNRDLDAQAQRQCRGREQRDLRPSGTRRGAEGLPDQRRTNMPAASAPKPCTAACQPNAVARCALGREVGDERLLAPLHGGRVDAVDAGTIRPAPASTGSTRSRRRRPRRSPSP